MVEVSEKMGKTNQAISLSHFIAFISSCGTEECSESNTYISLTEQEFLIWASRLFTQAIPFQSTQQQHLPELRSQ